MKCPASAATLFVCRVRAPRARHQRVIDARDVQSSTVPECSKIPFKWADVGRTVSLVICVRDSKNRSVHVGYRDLGLAGGCIADPPAFFA